MIYSVLGEQPFQVNSDSFSVSPSESGYDLYLSADGVNYSNFATVAANTTRQFTSMNSGNYYILSGNTSEVKVNWDRECHGGGGGGGTAGVSSLDGQTGALTTKTINGNAILGSGDIEISGGTGGKTKLYYSLDSGTTQEAEAIANLAVSSGLSAFCDTYELILLSNGKYYIPTQFSLDDVGDDEYWLTFYIQNFGNTYVDMVGMATKNRGFFPINQFWYSDNYNSVFMLTLNDLTGGTPSWRTYANFDDLTNLKDNHNNGKAFINIYLFYDLGNENKPYAVATAWRYDGENGNSDFYFYFDDVEVNNTRYRGVYKWNSNNSSWTTVYWDTWANYTGLGDIETLLSQI